MKRKLQEAKNRLNEVVKASKTKGPQNITAHGKDNAAVVAMSDLHRLQKNDLPLGSALWARAPKVNMVIERSRDIGRDVAFD